MTSDQQYPTIRNPILPGFNPDPALCVVGEDIYIATSTFEWWPGVQIHHSRDLVHWRLAARPLTRRSQLDLLGVPNSGGVWAPCLTYAHGLFWLVYTNTHELNSAFKDSPNYVVTSPRIEGPWSEPSFLNATGFDPSLFHDEDGRSWLTTMRWSHLPGSNRFDGIVLQEFDREQRCLIGDERLIFAGTSLGCTEGPHLYHWGACYYLVTAEGGTGVNHAVTVARAPRIEGPYEVHPENPILTSVAAPAQSLQKCGHGGIAQLADGSWWLTHLCARPQVDGRCMLGRETAIQPLVMGADGWPRLAHGGRFPQTEVPGPNLPAHPFPPATQEVLLGEVDLAQEFQSPRLPISQSWCDRHQPTKWLRVRGGESPMSHFRQHCLAQRRQDFIASVETRVQAQPAHYQHQAALMALYDTQTWFALGLTHRPDLGPCLVLSFADDGQYGEYAEATTAVNGADGISLRLSVDHGRLNFFWRQSDDQPWQAIGPDCDASRLSDEYGSGWKFTGSWFAIHTMDLSAHRWTADWQYFRHQRGPE